MSISPRCSSCKMVMIAAPMPLRIVTQTQTQRESQSRYKGLHGLALRPSLTLPSHQSSACHPQQQPWGPMCSTTNIPSRLQPQGLCTCYSCRQSVIWLISSSLTLCFDEKAQWGLPDHHMWNCITHTQASPSSFPFLHSTYYLLTVYTLCVSLQWLSFCLSSPSTKAVSLSCSLLNSKLPK